MADKLSDTITKWTARVCRLFIVGQEHEDSKGTLDVFKSPSLQWFWNVDLSALIVH